MSAPLVKQDAEGLRQELLEAFDAAPWQELFSRVLACARTVLEGMSFSRDEAYLVHALADLFGNPQRCYDWMRAHASDEDECGITAFLERHRADTQAKQE